MWHTSAASLSLSFDASAVVVCWEAAPMRRGAAHDGELLAEKLVTSHFTWIQSSGVFWVHFLGQ